MNEKDKIILQESSLAILENMVALIPGLNLAWDLGKAYLGAAIRLREKKALEFVEVIRDNPDVFISDIIRTEVFQDGFVVMLEDYLKERNEAKRKVMRNIFLGFTSSDNKNTFPLEKYNHTLSQLNELDILVLKDVDIERTDRNYQIYGSDKKCIPNIFNLIHLGLLINATGDRMGAIDVPFVAISDFGREFIKYVKF